MPFAPERDSRHCRVPRRLALLLDDLVDHQDATLHPPRLRSRTPCRP
jgi:hypothetical protein